MKEAVWAIVSMCMFTAICAQFFTESKYIRIVRMLMGMQLFLTVVTVLSKWIETLK